MNYFKWHSWMMGSQGWCPLTRVVDHWQLAIVAIIIESTHVRLSKRDCVTLASPKHLNPQSKISSCHWFWRSKSIKLQNGNREFSCMADNRRRMDVRKIFWYFGRENSGIFHQWSCVVDRLNFQFPDETGRCFRGHISQVRWVVARRTSRFVKN